MPALLTRPNSVSPASAAATCFAPAATAASSVTSKISGVKFAPNSFVEPLSVSLLAHAAEDAESARDENLDAAPADAGGDAGDDDRSH